MSIAPGDPTADVQVVTIAPDGSLGPSVGRLLAHQPPGILHLAVSVALVDADGRWLLQRRAGSKAAFPERWANSCCTHPEPGEDPADAARRRVGQELGLDVAGLEPAGTFIYQATDPVSGLVEHELDHVFVAVVDTSSAAPDPEEIGDLARLPLGEALELVESATGTPWAPEVLRLASRHSREGDAPPA
ncbi:MAG TPA: isopentenyl-diphosphate Delta-isomerase [Solirubrobacteraceae bacterium]|jgi:isopentenyl-diphosphate delta-isomerase|nr:isopentenyl-diphosphate Delta-isomerase [Solirubrobacteraceae bacterium]